MTWTFFPTETENRLAAFIVARMRIGGSGVIQGTKSPEEWERHRMRGQLAQLMVARAFNVFPNMEDGTPQSRDAWDLAYGDSTVDVKCPENTQAGLRVPKRDPQPHADAYVLVHATHDGGFTLAGWCWSRDIINNGFLHVRGTGYNDAWYERPLPLLNGMDDAHFIRMGAPRNAKAR